MAGGGRLQAAVHVVSLCVHRAGADARSQLRPRHHRQRWPAAPALLARCSRPRLHDEGVSLLCGHVQSDSLCRLSESAAGDFVYECPEVSGIAILQLILIECPTPCDTLCSVPSTFSHKPSTFSHVLPALGELLECPTSCDGPFATVWPWIQSDTIRESGWRRLGLNKGCGVGSREWRQGCARWQLQAR